MLSSDTLLDESDLNKLHYVIARQMNEMSGISIQDNVLNRSTLVKKLKNMILHKEIENYFCFTELNLNNLVKNFMSIR